jgi:hypothetical protein
VSSKKSVWEFGKDSTESEKQNLNQISVVNLVWSGKEPERRAMPLRYFRSNHHRIIRPPHAQLSASAMPLMCLQLDGGGSCSCAPCSSQRRVMPARMAAWRPWHIAISMFSGNRPLHIRQERRCGAWQSCMRCKSSSLPDVHYGQQNVRRNSCF